jgi:hypothetical protein
MIIRDIPKSILRSKAIDTHTDQSRKGKEDECEREFNNLIE